MNHVFSPMNRIIILLISFWFIGNSSAFAQKLPVQKDGLTWYTDIIQARVISDSTHKPIFAFFTGSDWCGWCHKLQRDVFAKAAFKEWAKQNVILVELDYPRSKQLPADLAQQNAELQQVFQVSGYPTIWMFNLDWDEANKRMNIVPFGSLGYPRGAEQGKEEVKFLAEANALLAQPQPKTN
jgi:thioredoxin-related protein